MYVPILDENRSFRMIGTFKCVRSIDRVSHPPYSQYPQAASISNAKGKIPLHYAAREGRLEVVQFFLQAAPYTASIASNKQKLALHFAAGDGHVEVAKLLLQTFPQGASMASSKGKIPLHFAARWGHLQIAADLLYVHPSGVQTLDWECATPLHDAAREGQFEMGRYLIGLYPDALRSANIRSEIPLFPAVRSGNVDLVVEMIQVWPAGGAHVLKSLSVDDDIASWEWTILELLLRGAVGNFEGCATLEGRETSSALLPPDAPVIPALPDGTRVKKGKKKPSLFPDTPRDSPVPDTDEVAPVKLSSPECVKDDGKRQCSTSLEGSMQLQKRLRVEGSPKEGIDCEQPSTEPVDDISDDKVSAVSKFLPLHAALQVGAPVHFVEYVYRKTPGDARKPNGAGLYPLHLALGSWLNKATTQFVEQLVGDYPEAVSVRDRQNRLPLHLAISATADVRLIDVLLQAYPPAGIDCCGSNDAWRNASPIELACHNDCDLNTVFTLLRVDPNFIVSRDAVYT